jgi:hypothetical protein
MKVGLSGSVLDVTTEGPRSVLKAARVLVEVNQVTDSPHQSLIRLAEGCGVDIDLDPLVRTDSIHERCQEPLVAG